MINIRNNPKQSDLSAVRNILESSGYFYDHEITVALELVQETLDDKENSTYRFIFADDDDRTIGFTCYGLIPCTVASYDLYWIAVHEDYRGKGIGRIILDETESIISGENGHQLFIETSNRPLYHSTRSFYLKAGFTETVVIKDFYDMNDDKVIYSKIIRVTVA